MFSLTTNDMQALLEPEATRIGAVELELADASGQKAEPLGLDAALPRMLRTNAEVWLVFTCGLPCLHCLPVAALWTTLP